MTGQGDDRVGQDHEDWQDHAADHDGEPLETEQLELAEEEERLPWLESSEDEEWSEYEGSGTGRLLGLVVMGLVALAAIVGGIWWATHRTPDPALVADGSTIEAPGTPYKEAPKNPGGKTCDGTGDSSFAVSEGQNRPAQLGKDGQTVKAISMAARQEISGIIERPVHLFIFVKVRENWADDPERFREMGLEYPRK